jgi:AcrR family transcriptional regulator
MVAETAVTSKREAAPERRGDLLARATDHVLAHGLGDLSLRPLAAALGTSARMLVYHFGSKEALVVSILDEVRRRKHRDLAAAQEHAMRAYWDWAQSAEGQRYLRLVYEVYGLSLHDPARFGAFLADETADEIAFIEAMLAAGGVPARALPSLSTYTFAALRGLELDLLATGDVARVNAAYDMFQQDLARRLGDIAATARTKGARR